MSHRHRAALGALVAALAVLFFVEGALLPTAWLPLEEAPTLEHARGQASAENANGFLYSELLAPVARSVSPSTAERLAKALSALLWALSAIPAYLLARRLVSRDVALAVAAFAVVVPGSVYATAAVPDALAQLLAVSALALLARGSLGAAVAFALAAALTRPWFVVLPPALLLAHELSRERRTFLRWPGSLVFAGLAAFAYLVLATTAPEVGGVLSSPGAWARAAAASLAVAVVGAGVLPWLLAMSRRRGETALLATTLPALVLAAGVFGAASGLGVDERPLLALVPLVLALAASAAEISLRSAVVAGALVALAALALPALGRAPAVHAAGLSLFAPDGGSRARLVAEVAVATAAALVLLAVLRRRRRALAAALAVILVGGHAAAWWSVRSEARALAATEPGPHGWVDRSAGAGTDVFVVGPSQALDERTLAQLTLWNRTLRGVRALDLTNVDPKTGLLAGPDTDLVLVRGGTELAGTEIARSSGGVLLRSSPLQLAETVEGLYADGWSGGQAVYRRFGGPPRAGTVRVTVSRAAWTGTDRPGEVAVASGPLEGEATPRAHVEIHAGEERELAVDVPPPPFQVVVTVSPTFSPAEFGGTDERQLGAQLRFAYARE